MPQEDIRVLVVDDSAVSRAILCDQIEAAPGMSVAGRARDGLAALEKVGSLHPDVITLDLQMPGMDGLAVLDAMLAADPIRSPRSCFPRFAARPAWTFAA
jgi:two-component system chemotaxis response regulator CheB